MCIKEKLQELAAETDEVKKSAFFESYLKTMAKFWKYSAYNQFLIFLRNPNATHVAGFHRWRKLGRYVKSGVRSFHIASTCGSEVIAFRKSAGTLCRLAIVFFIVSYLIINKY